MLFIIDNFFSKFQRFEYAILSNFIQVRLMGIDNSWKAVW